ncbi:MAG TPA: hypothetical protein PLD27_05895 [bacterium]|nr:hypothetical protein [bacterium]HOL47179.1 hypothetical protein [bacterium]HPQ17672.1 hypothetical protein [bacterium]
MINEKIKNTIRDLIWLADETKTNFVSYADNEIKIRFRKAFQNKEIIIPEIKETAEKTEKKEEVLSQPKKIIKSERVGFIYLISTKTKRYFVNEGAAIKEGDILAVINSMKIEYPIKSPYTGKIKRIFVDNAQPVEYGQTLFEIE